MKFPLTIIFLLITSFLFAQQNLIPNPSFEDTIMCPFGQGQINYAKNWNKIYPFGGGSDYYHSCNTGGFGVPNNWCGLEMAHSGEAYAGIGVFLYGWPDYRDYLQVHLTDSLIPGIKYYVEFYVSLADSVYYACNDMGMFFSNDSITSNNNNNLPYTPQISNSYGNFLTNKNGWTKISGYYTAIGGEKFIVIGNFKNNASSDTVYVGGQPSSITNWQQSYYYVDDVNVIQDTATEVEDIKDNNILCNIFPNPATNELTIDFAMTDKCFFELYDVIGAKRMTVTLDNGVRTKRVNLTDINSGLYFYSVVDKNGDRLKTGKLIINK